jgi:TonB family protein
MSENILVVEYEPRYTDRVRQALAGQPFTPLFAKDGEEALRAIEGDAPRLIVLSSVVPKVSTPELIRAIRNRNSLASTPILLTVSGYSGKSPKQDAVRMGASDILPKPYSESEFLGKVQQMLGVRAASPAAGGGLTSNEIFGDLLEDDRGAPSGARKTAMKPKDDVDKMLADTLAGMMPQRKKDATVAQPVTPPPAPPKPQPPQSPKTVAQPLPAPPPSAAEPKRTQSTSDLDKLLSDTLSGQRKPGSMATQAGTTAVPRPAAPQPAPPPRPATQPAQPTPPSGKYITEKLTFTKPPAEEKVIVSQPVFPQAAPLTAPFEDEEPTDGIKFGQYVLLDKIATGGMAEVWKARMRGVEGFQKTVAIKKILPHLSDNQDFIEMFIDEAKLAAQLNHNNIIHIYDLGKIQSSYYIAMEYIDGYDLKTILKFAADRDNPLNVELALFIAAKIAAALDYAHRKRDFEDRDLGLVHRDVSPQNVLISQDGDIKLCDFGIAKAASKASHTQAGALKGKLQYMSPEQAWGRAIDKRSDIFALATVLFELLTGRKLFTGDNELSILEQVREARVTAPSKYNDEVTPQIDAIVVKALQKDPANRYQTAGEMERDINQVLYSFKPTPTAADLAIFMHRLSTSEAAPLPASSMSMPEPEPVREPGQLKPAASHAAPPPPMAPVIPIAAEPAAAAYVPPAATEKKLPIVPIVIAAVVVIAALGGWLAMRGKSSAPTSTTAAAKPGASPVVPTSATSATTPAVGQANAGPALGIPPTATTATFDPSKVDAEVAKRLAAEKTRLDQEAAKRAQQPQTSTQVAQARPVPQPVVPAPQPVAPAPQPVAPAPQPVVQQPVPQPVVPQPQPTEPQVARAREGDLVPAGTEGLNPPRMTRQAALTYPQVARIQRIEGSVLLSVLVSENGAVQDVRVIRGDPRLSDAAVQTVRRSGFSPGTKDGVRVKSWVPVTISFKL